MTSFPPKNQNFFIIAIIFAQNRGRSLVTDIIATYHDVTTKRINMAAALGVQFSNPLCKFYLNLIITIKISIILYWKFLFQIFFLVCVTKLWQKVVKFFYIFSSSIRWLTPIAFFTLSAPVSGENNRFNDKILFFRGKWRRLWRHSRRKKPQNF